MTNFTLYRAGVAILLLIFCYQLWSLEIAHTDDAVWFLASQLGNWKIIEDFAVNQGRVWALVSGAILYVSLYFHGTLLGDLLRVGSLAVFFVLFYKVASLYFGQRIALLAATFNLGLYALRWEGSIATTYPAIFWVLGSVFLCAVLMGWNFIKNGGCKYLFACIFMFALSLFVHEGASVLLSAIFLLAAYANYFLLHPINSSRLGFFSVTNNRLLMFGGLTVILLYFTLYFLWRLYFPSNYEGNTLGSFNLARVIPVLVSLSTSGSVLSDLISPYSVNFADAVNYDGFRVTYDLVSYFDSSLGGVVAWLFAAIVTFVVFSVLMSYRNQKDAVIGKIQTSVLAGFIVGLLIMILPILPVALVGKYQQHYYELGVHSHAFTALSHFGITLSLASFVVGLLAILNHGRNFQIVISSFLALSTGALALCGYRMNSEIVDDISVEQNRWRVVDQAMPMTTLLGPSIQAIYAPRLQSGSWFTVVDDNYWSKYVAIFHDKNYTFYRDPLPEIIEGDPKIAFMDYSLARDSKQLVIFMAPIAKTETIGQIVADRILVSVENPSPSDMSQFILSYKDYSRGPISVRYSQLEAVDKSGMKIIKGVSADPASIRFERNSMIRHLLIPCGSSLEMGTRVLFGNSPMITQQSCSGSKMLREGWHSMEHSGAWSKSNIALVTLPTAGLRHGPLELSFNIGTYVGLGFTNGTQRISILAGNKTIATRLDEKGVGPQLLKVIIPPSEWSPRQDLDLTLKVDHTINPAGNNISTDVRDLGLHLYSLEVGST